MKPQKAKWLKTFDVLVITISIPIVLPLQLAHV